MQKHPNLVFVFADQWRAQSFGYAGNPDVKTPNIDRFAAAGLNFSNAVSGCPVCTPYRASLMTGQYPHRHRLMVNDQCLTESAAGPFLAECLSDAGYTTAYIGKWHVDGHGRNSYIPENRRLGFEFWRTFECTHNYQNSYYYADHDPKPCKWDGYDATSQTREACRYLREETADQTFALFLSWGPPHNPFGSAPAEFEAMYDPDAITLPANVAPEVAAQAKQELAGYYAHCSALDAAFGELIETITDTGHDQDTVVIFTSDHGDMLGSQNLFRKQKPWAESVRVPFLIRHPDGVGPDEDDSPINAPDLMPTLLELCGANIPTAVQGTSFAGRVREGAHTGIDAALLALYCPFHEWRFDNGGREFRGLHTRRYTYIRTLQDGPWLLYDNPNDPLQMQNLIGDPEHAELVQRLDKQLTERLEAVGDDFKPGRVYLEEDNVALNENGDILIQPDELPDPYPPGVRPS